MDEQNTYTNYSMQPGGKAIKGKVVLIIVFLMLVLAGYWLSTVSFIEVSVSGLENGRDISYQFYNQGSQKTSTVKSQASSIKKRLTKGNYEVLVTQGEKSSFAVVKARGFFQTTQITGNLQAEKGRRFIGDAPEACMHVLDHIFISYACNDVFSNIKIHLPATHTQPTYANKNPSSTLTGYTEGLVKTTGGYVALILWPSDGEAPAAHFAYKVSGELATSEETLLKDLDGDKSYTIKPYKEGFAIYDSSFEKILYYSSLGASPTSITISKPKTSDLQPTTLDLQQDRVLTLHTTSTDAKGGRSEVVFVSNKQSKHFTFKKTYSAGYFCGDQKACLLGNKTLDIYDINGSKPGLLFAVSNVASINNTQAGLVVIQKDKIVRLDIDKRAGFIEYSLGRYSFSSIQPEDGGYIVSLTSNKGKRAALFIDQQKDNTDSIDKKVLALQNLPEVNTVSANNMYVYVSPNLGSLVYVDALGSFDYDPFVKKSVTAKINAEIDKLGIDRNTYIIINTVE